jgi:serine/threonine-protein kinase RsbW
VPAEEALTRLSAAVVPESLERVHAGLEELWRQADDVGLEDRIRFETAVAEVAGNIVQHSGAVSGHFEVELRADADRLEARFRDEGERVEVDLSAAHLPADLAESGRGLALTLAAVDELEYRREGRTNHWRVLRRRRP